LAIVLPDADLDLAATLTIAGAMRYAGQKCTATSRLVVAKKVAEDLYARLKVQAEALPLGPVTDPAAAVGPLINAAARDFVRDAVSGTPARRITGGGPPHDPPVPKRPLF